jgi:rare lipoprotein A
MIVIGGIVVAASPQAHTAKKSPTKVRVLATQIGDATYYSSRFEGRKTASGRIFDGDEPVAAHRTYRFGTVVRVTNVRNRRSVNVVIVDRGPFGKNPREGAIVDLSPSAARQIGIIKEGHARVRLEVLAWGNGEYVNDSDLAALNSASH